MKMLRHALCIWLLGILLVSTNAWAQPGPRALILYDAPPGQDQTKLGQGYAIMLHNLLGHFESSVDMVPVQNYTAGTLEGYDATFYLGSYYDNPLPAILLTDVVRTRKTVVWFKFNLWQMAWNPAYNFQSHFGFAFRGLRGLNTPPTAANPEPGFFDTINYKNLPFKKYYTFDAASGFANADPDLGVTSITDAAKAQSVVSVSNPRSGESAPYIVRSGNFWYVADIPFTYIGPRDRYLVLADILHDMLGVNHVEFHYAMVRLEDVSALVNVAYMKTLSDFLYTRRIPFSIATIPFYADPLGTYNAGVPKSIPLSQATNLKTVLNYAWTRGADIIMHGHTHQYDSRRNAISGVSAEDYEFWDAVNNRPVAEDSMAWALGRYQAGLQQLSSNGYIATAWETPHYQASALAYKAAAQTFRRTYQRVVYYTADKPAFNAPVERDFAMGQIFPYVIKTDYYGQMVLPENLGNIQYAIGGGGISYTSQDILTNARYVMAVRDGIASFFFHPFLLDPGLGVPAMADFQKTVDGITNMGFTWTVPGWWP